MCLPRSAGKKGEKFKEYNHKKPFKEHTLCNLCHNIYVRVYGLWKYKEEDAPLLAS